MPTYEYRCDTCGKNFDVVQSFHDAPLTECPTCGSAVKKVFGSVGIVFKGSGFYKTDSRSGSGSSASRSGESTPAADAGGRLRRQRVVLRLDVERLLGIVGNDAGSEAGRRLEGRQEHLHHHEGLTGSASRTLRSGAGRGRRRIGAEATTLRISPFAQSGPLQWSHGHRRPRSTPDDARGVRRLRPPRQGRGPAQDAHRRITAHTPRGTGLHRRGHPAHRRSDDDRDRARDVPLAARSGLRLQRARHRTLPGQCLLPAVVDRPGHPTRAGHPRPPPTNSACRRWSPSWPRRCVGWCW